MPALPGNQNAVKPRDWEAAIRRAVARAEHDPKIYHRSLNSLADRLLDKAAEGDMAAIKELGDRLDGKAAQAVAVTGAEGGPLETKVTIEYVTAAASLPVPENTEGG